VKLGIQTMLDVLALADPVASKLVLSVTVGLENGSAFETDNVTLDNATYWLRKCGEPEVWAIVPRDHIHAVYVKLDYAALRAAGLPCDLPTVLDHIKKTAA
jgi:hypothetical protein